MLIRGKLSLAQINHYDRLSYVEQDIQASVYGKCIAADYNNVFKDKCLQEFLRLKECYLVCTSYHTRAHPAALLTLIMTNRPLRSASDSMEINYHFHHMFLCELVYILMMPLARARVLLELLSWTHTSLFFIYLCWNTSLYVCLYSSFTKRNKKVAFWTSCCSSMMRPS